MSLQDFYRTHLHEYLDAQGDLAPPWEAFPAYTRYTIGWRMGSGETWLGFWWFFLQCLGSDLDARLAYLRRHPPAPISWSDTVWAALHPEAARDQGADDEHRAWLRAQGLIAPDVAYSTWRKAQREFVWPWSQPWSSSWCETPEGCARYATRDLAFWARHAAELRAAGPLPPVDPPPAWASVVLAARQGEATIVPTKGLRSLACALAAGTVPTPWRLGLAPEDFRGSLDQDMGYADAFRLWFMSVFDDKESADGYLAGAPPPPAWQPCIARYLLIA